MCAYVCAREIWIKKTYKEKEIRWQREDSTKEKEKETKK